MAVLSARRGGGEMKKIMARIPCGKTVLIQEVELYTVEEAKTLLADKEWSIDVDIYSIEKTNQKIGWLASVDNGKDGIYVEYK